MNSNEEEKEVIIGRGREETDEESAKRRKFFEGVAEGKRAENAGSIAPKTPRVGRDKLEKYGGVEVVKDTEKEQKGERK